MKTPSAPAAPDPVKTAQAQTATNISTAVANSALNNVNQVTPDGTLTYTQTGNRFIEDSTTGQNYWRGPNGEIQSSAPMTTTAGTTTRQPIYRLDGGKNGSGQQVISGYKNVTTGGGSKAADGWSQVKGYYIPTSTATQTLSPAQQAIKDQNDAAELNLGTIANQQSGFLRDYLARPVTADGLPAAGDVSSIAAPQYERLSNTDYEDSRKRVEDALYSRLNPQIERDLETTRTQLVNQGIRVGSPAWTAAMSDFNRGVADQRTSITLAGGEEQSRLAGLDLQRLGFNNTVTGQERAAQVEKFNMQNAARSSAMQEQFAYRNQPLNEISALMSGSQVSQPQWAQSAQSNIPTTDYAGLVQQNYQAKLQAWQQAQASKQGVLGGLFGLGSSLIAASDRRLKTDIERVGTGPLGLAVYVFRYVWGGPLRLGFMAQEVARVLPEAVLSMPNGYLAVDYGKVLESA